MSGFVSSARNSSLWDSRKEINDSLAGDPGSKSGWPSRASLKREQHSLCSSRIRISLQNLVEDYILVGWKPTPDSLGHR